MKRQLDNPSDANPRRSKRSSVVSNRDNNYPYVLIVIDMQPNFGCSNNPKTLDAVADLINNAKHDNAFIVYAQYMRQGKTHTNLVKLTNGYINRSFAVANRNDKSGAILTRLVKRQVRSDLVKVCGVNTNACVRATVEGLSNELKEWSIQVIKKACNSYGEYTDDAFYANNAYKTMKLLPNVTVH